MSCQRYAQHPRGPLGTDPTPPPPPSGNGQTPDAPRIIRAGSQFPTPLPQDISKAIQSYISNTCKDWAWSDAYQTALIYSTNTSDSSLQNIAQNHLQLLWQRSARKCVECIATLLTLLSAALWAANSQWIKSRALQHQTDTLLCVAIPCLLISSVWKAFEEKWATQFLETVRSYATSRNICLDLN